MHAESPLRFRRDEPTTAEAIDLLGRRLTYIDQSESGRGMPGSGSVHCDDVLAGLRGIGYRARLAMESLVAVNEAIIAATAMRSVAPDPDALVRDGLAFLRAKRRNSRVD